MMKTNVLIMVAITTLISLTSCNKNEESVGNPNFPVDGVIRITPEVKTRAGATTSNLAELGLSVTNSSNAGFSYSNVQMTKSGGIWSSATIMLWQNGTQAVDILAYSPYKSGTDYTVTSAVANVKANQSATDQSDIIASDFLAVRKPAFIPNAALVNGNLPLELKHLMSKLRINITLGKVFNPLFNPSTPIKNLIVKGTKIKGVCDFTTLIVSTATTDNDATTIIPFASEYILPTNDNTTNTIAKYECIIVPQNVAAKSFEVSLYIDNEYYVWKLDAALTFEGGMQYDLNLTIGDSEIIGKIEVSTSAWIEGIGGDLATQ